MEREPDEDFQRRVRVLFRAPGNPRFSEAGPVHRCPACGVEIQEVTPRGRKIRMIMEVAPARLYDNSAGDPHYALLDQRHHCPNPTPGIPGKGPATSRRKTGAPGKETRPPKPQPDPMRNASGFDPIQLIPKQTPWVLDLE